MLNLSFLNSLKHERSLRTSSSGESRKTEFVLGQNVEVLETNNSDVLADEVTEDKNPLLDESAENNEFEEFNNESFLNETA